jgi:hypothetical protein
MRSRSGSRFECVKKHLLRVMRHLPTDAHRHRFGRLPSTPTEASLPVDEDRLSVRPDK